MQFNLKYLQKKRIKHKMKQSKLSKKIDLKILMIFICVYFKISIT